MRMMTSLLLLLLAAMPVNAQQLKIATLAPEASEWMQAMRGGAAEIKSRTDDRVQIKLFGGGIQGGDAAVLRKMRIGALQGGTFTPTAFVDIYPDVNLFSLPLLFDSEDEAAYVRQRMDRRLVEGLSEAGFISFGFAATGFAIIMSNEPVYGIEDLQGKKVWVPEGDTISYAAMQAMKLSPQTLPLTDVLTGLQTELIDIIPVSPIGALVMQWHTKVDYLTDMPLVYTIGFMVMDKKAFGKLQPGDQAIVQDVMSQIYAKFDKKNLVDDAAAKKALLSKHVKRVVPTDAEVARIRGIMAESNRSLANKGEFSADLYNEILGYVADYRRANSERACAQDPDSATERSC